MRLLLLAALAGLAACGQESSPSPAPATPSGGASPEKVKTIATGTRYSTEDYMLPGSVVLLEFTADW